MINIIATYVPPAGAAQAAMVRELMHPPAAATAVELRVDLLPQEVDLTELVSVCPRPVVLTMRSRAEGGEGPDNAAERRRFFERVAALPVLAFDLESARDLSLLGEVVPRQRAIVSRHFEGVPAEFERTARQLLELGTLFVKVVPTTNNLRDLLDVVRVASRLGANADGRKRAVVFAAGEGGRATRLLGPLLAAPVGYAAWETERIAAAGQYTASELVALVGHLQGPPHRIRAVLGRFSGRSLSPRMHNAAYQALGLQDLFVPLEIGSQAELEELVQPAGLGAVERLGLRSGGFAVTMPWKEAALKLCSLVAPRAARARAVNTVLPRPGKVLGDCTDIDGILRALGDARVALGQARAVVLGAGGSARAAVVALQAAGCAVAVAGRDKAKAAALAQEFGAVAIEAKAATRCTVAVNATPAGKDDAPAELLEELRLGPDAVVVDLPYGAGPTRLQRLARERGWRYIGGREVLLWQGVAQFAAMTGMASPVETMASALGLPTGEQP